MLRPAIICLVFVLSIFDIRGQSQYAIVADSTTHKPLPSASIFNRKGAPVGICNSKGKTPYLSEADFPITVRYLGFKEKTLSTIEGDTIFLQENPTELPEIIVESRQQKVMHMLAYVREYSTLTNYTDTVFLFREKMVDYMLPSNKKIKFKGWTIPRIIKTKSYYRFTNAQGLDSVSDRSNYHFSWSDWVGVVPATELPPALRNAEYETETLYGKYSPTEVWTKNNDRITVDVNVLADTASRKWVPNLSSFFHYDLDFENFRIQFNYDNIATDSVSPENVTGYSYNIESNGRGREMFKFNRADEQFFASTYAEVYMLDKEYITVKEAKKWEKHDFDTDEIEIIEPIEAPDLQPATLALVERVNNIDKERVRLSFTPDPRIGSRKEVNRSFQFGNRVLTLLKQLTGITLYKSHKKFNNNWNEFRDKTRKSKRHNKR